MSGEKEPFWDTQRILLVGVFVIGLIIGIGITNQVIDPFINEGVISDQNTLSELNTRLDSRNDELYNCLLENEINPSSCN